MPDDRNLILPFRTLEELIEASRRDRGADPKPRPPVWWNPYRNLYYSCDLHAGGSACSGDHAHDTPEGRKAVMLTRLGIGVGAATLLLGWVTPLPFIYALAAVLCEAVGYVSYIPYLRAKAMWRAHAAERESSDVMLLDGDHMVEYLKKWLYRAEQTWFGEDSALQIALNECEGKLNLAIQDAKEQAQDLAVTVNAEAVALLREAQDINLKLTNALVDEKKRIIRQMNAYRQRGGNIDQWISSFESYINAAKRLDQQRKRLMHAAQHGTDVGDVLETIKQQADETFAGISHAIATIAEHAAQTVAAIDGASCNRDDFRRLDSFLQATPDEIPAPADAGAEAPDQLTEDQAEDLFWGAPPDPDDDPDPTK
ncbi:hypothetical protein HY633_00855 [Candidatus Uhrbacteria bacterium]|nr:hypothetical protein [Candidatus Uhrbacteria bacterium]